MYKYQLKRLFSKYLLVILICVFAMAAVKAVVVISMNNVEIMSYLTKSQTEHYNGLLEESSGMSLAERAEYIYNYSLESSQNNNADVLAAISKYNYRLDDCFVVEGVINYSKTGSGLVSAEIPLDLLENAQLYASLDQPEVINDEPFLKLLELQSWSIVPIVIMLVVGVFIADSYEKGIHLVINISKQAKKFYRSRELILAGFIFLLHGINFSADLLISGFDLSAEYMNATVQSVNFFGFSHINLTIGQVTGWLYVTSLLSVYICYGIFLLTARKARSMKIYITVCAGVIIIMSAFAIYLPNSAPYVFAAITDKNVMLRCIDYIPFIGASEIVTVLAVYLLILAGISAWRFAGYLNFDGKNAKCR